LQQIWNVFELPRLMHEVEAGAHGVAVQWKQYDEPVGVQGLPQAPLSHVHVEYPPLHPSGIFATLFCMRDLPRAADVLAFAKGATMSSPIPIVAILDPVVARKSLTHRLSFSLPLERHHDKRRLRHPSSYLTRDQRSGFVTSSQWLPRI
jgi:hypothetical protein